MTPAAGGISVLMERSVSTVLIGIEGLLTFNIHEKCPPQPGIKEPVGLVTIWMGARPFSRV